MAVMGIIIVVLLTMFYFSDYLGARVEYRKAEVELLKLQCEEKDRMLHPEKYMTKEELEVSQRVKAETAKVNEKIQMISNYTGIIE